MLKIARRVGLLDASGAFFLRHLPRAQAQSLLDDGAIVACESRGSEVVGCRLTGTKVPTSDCRPGSYNIVHEHLDCGGAIYSHHRELYAELAT